VKEVYPNGPNNTSNEKIHLLIVTNDSEFFAMNNRLLGSLSIILDTSQDLGCSLDKDDTMQAATGM
jgi:hypothetical protein